jgi:glycosyltransferase involved in cell wall biosynthesis
MKNEASGGELRILVDARIGWGSGIGRYVVNTVPLVTDAMPDVAFEILVGPNDAATANDLANGRPNLSVSVSDVAPFSIQEQLQLPERLGRYDLVWFTNYWVPLAFRGRFIAIVHDMLHQEPTLFPASRLKRTLSKLTFRHVAARAAGLCFGSRFSQREFERRFRTDAHQVVTGYGIDHAGWRLFDPEQPPQKKPHLLIVAAAKKHKNFQIAIDAFARALVASHWQLTIITPNDALRSSIDLGALSLGARNVVFRQGVSNDELWTMYGETAVLLMPSLYEGFGLPLAEGLQAGAACISATAQSLVELGQGATVTYVNGNDLHGWTRAIEDECARFDARQVDEAATIKNMQHAMQFRWQGVADQTVAMLRDLLSSNLQSGTTS